MKYLVCKVINVLYIKEIVSKKKVCQFVGPRNFVTSILNDH